MGAKTSALWQCPKDWNKKLQGFAWEIRNFEMKQPRKQKLEKGNGSTGANARNSQDGT